MPTSSGRAGAATTTSGKHRSHGLVMIAQHQTSRGNCGARSVAIGRWRFPQKLAVSRVAKIEIVMTSPRRNQIGSRGHSLSFHGFQRRIRIALRLYHRGDGSLKLHADHWNETARVDRDFQLATIPATDFSGNGEHQIRSGTAAARNANRGRSNSLVADLQGKNIP